jgi:hypothetical protein
MLCTTAKMSHFMATSMASMTVCVLFLGEGTVSALAYDVACVRQSTRIGHRWVHGWKQ